MPTPRRDARGGSFAMPLVGIAVLLAFYWMLSDWHELPVMISSTLTGFHWLY